MLHMMTSGTLKQVFATTVHMRVKKCDFRTQDMYSEQKNVKAASQFFLACVIIPLVKFGDESDDSDTIFADGVSRLEIIEGKLYTENYTKILSTHLIKGTTDFGVDVI